MKRWQFWLGIVISLIFLFWALRGLQLAELGDALRRGNYWWLIPGVVSYFLGVVVRAWRWRYLVHPIENVSTRTMFPIVAIGYFGNNVFPARAGEVLRAAVLKRRTGVPISASLATIIVERVFDGVVMLAFIFINLPELAQLTGDSGIGGNIQTVAIAGAAVFLGGLVVFLLAAMFPRNAESVITWFILRLLPLRFRQKTLDLTVLFLDGLKALNSPQHALMIFFTSVVIWLFETCKYWFVMQGFSFEVSFFALMLMNGIVNLATTIPSAPGYVGTFDAPGIAVLTAYGVDQALAAAYTLVLHAALWLPITALGGYYLFAEGFRWRDGIKSVEGVEGTREDKGLRGAESAPGEAAPGGN